MSSGASLEETLAEAVSALGGQHRPGQLAMAQAVAAAIEDRRHLLVQAGTGTGKSLAYLVPALLHSRRVVVATATLALQHQLVERDLPALMRAVGAARDAATETPAEGAAAGAGEGLGAAATGDEAPGQGGSRARKGRLARASYAVLKGRSNYACLQRVRSGAPDDQDALIGAESVAEGSLGAEVLALRDWAEEQAESSGTGERDHAPRHGDRAWRQVSVSHRECLGAARCPFGQECFAELARERAHSADLVVTNHSLLAIDAIEGIPMIPSYDTVVVDEAHELVARVTQAATDDLSLGDVERLARRADRHVEARGATDPIDDLTGAGEALLDALLDVAPGRVDQLPDQLADAVAGVRDSARSLLSALPKASGGPTAGETGGSEAGVQQVRGWTQELFEVAARMASGSDRDVLWVSESPRIRGGRSLHVAPLDVSGPMRHGLLAEKTVVLTSATLQLGGDFDAVASTLGLRPRERCEVGTPASPASAAGEEAGAETEGGTSASGPQPWIGLDVGSPFDYARQGILYVAGHLPPPGRDGPGEAQLREIVELVDAAQGRTLGLFSSRRAAELAAEHVREALPHLTTLAQGDAHLSELTQQFVGDPHTNLFGTLGLWQGLDVPGDTCSLVILDRIPFPRPDDPLLSARQRAVDQRGGNGFMSVAATHAALLLAQGAGRLIRTTTDRGVVACLDPRLVTARYGSFLRASLPPMWQTRDGQLTRQALARLAEQAGQAGPPA